MVNRNQKDTAHRYDESTSIGMCPGPKLSRESRTVCAVRSFATNSKYQYVRQKEDRDSMVLGTLRINQPNLCIPWPLLCSLWSHADGCMGDVTVGNPSVFAQSSGRTPSMGNCMASEHPCGLFSKARAEGSSWGRAQGRAQARGRVT